MQNNIDHGSAAAGLQALPDSVERQILAAVTGIQYGSVVIAIQDGRVVQIEATEKHRIAR